MNVLQHTRNELNLCLKQNRPDRSYRDTLLNRLNMLSKKTPSFFSYIRSYVIITRKRWAKVGGATMRKDNQRIIPVIHIRKKSSRMSNSLLDGFVSHTSIYSALNANTYVSDWHLVPVYPGSHRQAYRLMWSTQNPLFKQGLLEHSLMSVVKSTTRETEVNFSRQN